MADINDLFDCFDDPIGFDNANETNNPIVIEEETIEKWVFLSQFDQNFAVFIRFVFLIIIVTIYFCERQSTSTTEKRPLAEGESDSDEEPRKKPKPADIPVTESILDDICIEEIETRISVHVIETPEACTHEVAVYPGEPCLV